MIRVFIVCSGLGHVKRGYESFTQECFDTLSRDHSFDITLFKGGGKASKKEITLWNLPRDHQPAIHIGKVTERVIGRGAYVIEQTTFFLSLLPHIHRSKPDVIYFSDENLGNLLWYWRQWTKQNYKLLFSNGGPILPPFSRWDCIQQVAPTHFQAALSIGEPAEKQSLVPYGIYMSSELQILAPTEREALRRKLGLPEKRPLILSVGVIKKGHKRMDYVIREIASLPEPRPYLLLLGQQDSESPEIFELGNGLLGKDNFQTRSVEQNEVKNYYRIADVFVLASLSEGLPRVLLEAMSHGLPCLVHDYEIAQFAVGKEGYLANFKLTGSLTNLVPQALAEAHDVSRRYRRHHAVYKCFSWEKLRPDYVKLIQQCANSIPL